MSKYWIAKKDNLFVTDAAWYDKETRNKTRQMTDIAEKVLPIIRQMLNLSIENSKVVIGFCKAKNVYGLYSFDKKICRIDPRVTVLQFVDTIAHELTHAAQHSEGRLSAKGASFFWEEKMIGYLPTTYSKYLALPWEVEARAKAKEIVSTLKTMGMI